MNGLESSAPASAVAGVLVALPFSLPSWAIFLALGALVLLFVLLLFGGQRRRPEAAIFGESDHASPRAMRGYVLALLDAERQDDALQMAAGLLRALPGDTHMRALLGALYAGQGDHARACAEFERVVGQGGPVAPTVASFLASTCAVYALSLRALGRMADALRVEQEARRLNEAAADATAGGVELLAEHVRSDELERQAYEDLPRWEQGYAPAVPFGLPDLGEAVRFYMRAVAARPMKARLRADLGQALHASGDHMAAEREFREALRLDPGDAWAIFAYALMHWRLQHYTEAEQALNEALRIAPTQAGVLATRAIFAVSQGRLSEAERDVALAARERPDVAAIAWLRAVVAQRAGRMDTAERAYADAERLGATDLGFRVGYATAKEALADPAGAAEQYRLAMRLAPTHGPTRVAYAGFLLRQGHLRDAEAEAQEALRLPDGEGALTVMVRLLLLERRVLEVVTYLRPALERAPNSVELRILQADWMRRQDRFEQAVEMLRSGLTAESPFENNAEAQFVRGAALKLMNRETEANASLREALRLDPAMPERLLGQARALRTEDYVPQALDALWWALVLHPDWEPAQAEYEELMQVQRTRSNTRRRLTFGPPRSA